MDDPRGRTGGYSLEVTVSAFVASRTDRCHLRKWPTESPIAPTSSAHPARTPLLLSISPQILHDCARNLKRLGKPKQAHNYNKVNGDTEAGQQKDADEAGTMGESGCLQPPTSSRDADCADRLLAVRIPDHARETRHIGLKNHSISADPFRLPIAEA